MVDLMLRRREMVQIAAAPSVILYEMQTPMVFDGTTGVDTGFSPSGDYNSSSAPTFTILWEGTMANRSGDRFLFSLNCSSKNTYAINFSTYNNAGAYHAWFASSTSTGGQGWTNGDLIRVAFRTAPGEGAKYNWSRNGGTEKSKTFTTTPTGAVITDETIRVGTNRTGSTSGRFNGTVSLFRVYGRKFTDAEISNFLANGIA